MANRASGVVLDTAAVGAERSFRSSCARLAVLADRAAGWRHDSGLLVESAMLGTGLAHTHRPYEDNVGVP